MRSNAWPMWWQGKSYQFCFVIPFFWSIDHNDHVNWQLAFVENETETELFCLFERQTKNSME